MSVDLDGHVHPTDEQLLAWLESTKRYEDPGVVSSGWDACIPRLCREVMRLRNELAEHEAYRAREMKDLESLSGSVTADMLRGKLVVGCVPMQQQIGDNHGR